MYTKSTMFPSERVECSSSLVGSERNSKDIVSDPHSLGSYRVEEDDMRATALLSDNTQESDVFYMNGCSEMEDCKSDLPSVELKSEDDNLSGDNT